MRVFFGKNVEGLGCTELVGSGLTMHDVSLEQKFDCTLVHRLACAPRVYELDRGGLGQCINGKSCSITGTLPIWVILLILKCVIAPSFQGGYRFWV